MSWPYRIKNKLSLCLKKKLLKNILGNTPEDYERWKSVQGHKISGSGDFRRGSSREHATCFQKHYIVNQKLDKKYLSSFFRSPKTL